MTTPANILAWGSGPPRAYVPPQWPGALPQVIDPPGVYAPDQYRPGPPGGPAPRPLSESLPPPYAPPPYVPAPVPYVPAPPPFVPAPAPYVPAPTPVAPLEPPVEPPLGDDPGAPNPEEEDIGAPAPGSRPQRRRFFGIG